MCAPLLFCLMPCGRKKTAARSILERAAVFFIFYRVSSLTRRTPSMAEIAFTTSSSTGASMSSTV